MTARVRERVRRAETRLVEAVAEGPVGYAARQPGDVVALLAPVIGDRAQEVFVALALDSKHRVTGYSEVSTGALSNSLVHPREVFGWALRVGNVAALIVAHNHPSGDPEPSPEDLQVTRRLIEAGRILGVPLLDSIVIGDGDRYVSLRDRMDFGGVA